MSEMTEPPIVISDDRIPKHCPACGSVIINTKEARIVNPTTGRRQPFLCLNYKPEEANDPPAPSRRQAGRQPCHHQTWVSPNPVAIGIIFWRSPGGEIHILVEQRGIQPQQKKWAFVAGFMEPGHSVWQTVLSEAREEVGLDLSNTTRQILDQVPSKNNMIVMTFVAVLCPASDEPPTLTPDGTETLAAEWQPLAKFQGEEAAATRAFPWQDVFIPMAIRALGLTS
jgi:ADP-ribose pyrophosphatase YjhB (NUDIX family)